MRDFDLNPCACENRDLSFSNAQEFVPVKCTPSHLMIDDWSLSPSKFTQENAVNSGEIIGNSKKLIISHAHSEATVRDIDLNSCVSKS